MNEAAQAATAASDGLSLTIPMQTAVFVLSALLLALAGNEIRRRSRPRQGAPATPVCAAVLAPAIQEMKASAAAYAAAADKQAALIQKGQDEQTELLRQILNALLNGR